jgi:hypothetical protein
MNACNRVLVPAPNTQKGQLDAFFTALGVETFDAAINAIEGFKTNAQNWAAEFKALFELIGVTDQPAALSAITQIKSDRDALFKALGNAPDVESAIGAITNMQNDRNAIWKALNATDHSGAIAAVSTLNGRVTTAENAVTDFDGRLEKGIQEGVISRAAAAGIQAPIAKVPAAATPSGQPEIISPRRRLGQITNEQIGNQP